MPIKKQMSKSNYLILGLLLSSVAVLSVYLIFFKSHLNSSNQPIDRESTKGSGGYDGISWEAYEYDTDLGICRRYFAMNSKLPDKLPTLSDCERKNNVQVGKVDVVEVCKQFSDKNYPHFQNDCYFNFALAKRDDQLCQYVVENDYLKEKCVKDVVTVK